MISTHLLDEAETVCNRIILINRGRIVADGTAGEIIKKPAQKSGRSFLSIDNHGRRGIDEKLWIVTKNELLRYFISPLAYVYLVAFCC